MHRSSQALRPLVTRALAASLLLIVGAGCASQAQLPTPRPLINSAGARLSPETERMAAIDEWVQQHSLDIQNDPEFMIITDPVQPELYPWEAVQIEGDTANISVARTAPDARLIYEIYAHFYLMKAQDRLDEYLPEGIGLEGLDFELVVLDRLADAWLYGRSVFDMTPYQPLDELMYANEAGWLKALVLTARAAEFPAERREWLDENPDAAEDYRRWFRETFEMEPPGIR